MHERLQIQGDCVHTKSSDNNKILTTLREVCREQKWDQRKAALLCQDEVLQCTEVPTTTTTQATESSDRRALQT